MRRPLSPLFALSALVALSLLLLGLRSGAPAGAAAPLRGQAAKLRQVEAGQLAELLAQRKAAASPREALALQQRIEESKRQTELSLLRAQAEAARAAHETQLAEAIDAQILQVESTWSRSGSTSTHTSTPGPH